MSIVDLTHRITNIFLDYQNHFESTDSYVYCDDIENYTTCFLNMSVGKKYYDSNLTEKEIPQNGLDIKPKEFLIIETLEKIALPSNMIGVVTGKGTMIARGIIVSIGKIEPNFYDNLKISILNMSAIPLKLNTGDLFVSCYFLNMESMIPSREQRGEITAPHIRHLPHPPNKIVSFFIHHWYNLLPIIISIVTLIVAFIAAKPSTP